VTFLQNFNANITYFRQLGKYLSLIIDYWQKFVFNSACPELLAEFIAAKNSVYPTEINN